MIKKLLRDEQLFFYSKKVLSKLFQQAVDPLHFNSQFKLTSET